ncbi:hypothetical protein QR680_007901 [Steinernema hermaphroditum]|uniref:Uncharacterized protein n=1 Tax=Steinernema hermaphroditum TaxID=289476 RepID=A0AA39M625_9BILA|nr:hypothetical protein QR680_007901 [Steinernema hermaphroditum]
MKKAEINRAFPTAAFSMTLCVIDMICVIASHFKLQHNGQNLEKTDQMRLAAIVFLCLLVAELFLHFFVVLCFRFSKNEWLLIRSLAVFAFYEIVTVVIYAFFGSIAFFRFLPFLSGWLIAAFVITTVYTGVKLFTVLSFYKLFHVKRELWIRRAATVRYERRMNAARRAQMDTVVLPYSRDTPPAYVEEETVRSLDGPPEYSEQLPPDYDTIVNGGRNGHKEI